MDLRKRNQTRMLCWLAPRQTHCRASYNVLTQTLMLGNKHALASDYLGTGQQEHWAALYCDWACGAPLCLWCILFPPVRPPSSPHLFECSVSNSAQPQGGPSRLSICDGQGPYPHHWANVVIVVCYLQTAQPPPNPAPSPAPTSSVLSS